MRTKKPFDFMRLPACLAAVALLAAALPAVAVPVRGLYDASVAVPDQGPAAREAALRRALALVLLKVTGQRDVSTISIADRASVLLQGYGYENAPSGQGLRLRAQFDPRAVDAALRAQGLPVWGANRLGTLAWIALRDDGQPRALLDATGVAARAATAPAVAEARGLPFTFPELDAAERKRVRFDDTWSGNYAGIEAASRRYNADQILVGRVGRENGRWLGRWTLLQQNGSIEDWVGAYETLELALAAGIDELADRQAQRFATQTGGTARELKLAIAGVDTLDAYAGVLNYVKGLNSVRAVQVDGARAGELTLRVQVEGDPEMLGRVIASGRVLRRDDANSSGAFSSSQSYVLVR
ncbi:MAG TPA: DUF2066 domain-containing protein [Verrucomicrobiae bacterium]|nr:DUF2066 domain-containing protein [Verrucomicrobiae bacterium]